MRYRAKLLTALVTVTVCVLILLTANRVLLMRSYAKHRDKQHAQFICKYLAYELTREPQPPGAAEINQTLISLFVGEPDIAWIAVIDSAGIVRFSTHEKLLGMIDSLAYQAMESNGFRNIQPVEYDLSPYSAYAAIQIGYSFTETSRATRSSMLWGAGIGAVMIMVISGVSWRVSGLLLRPLHEMQQAVREVAQGQFSRRVPARSNDIIGQLAHSFNDMALKLELSAREMRQRIAEATAELESRNQDLLANKRELEQTNQRLNELDRLKTHFISIASHELRSPITSIRGFAQTLIELPFSESERIHYLHIIEEESARLSALIENFLDISRIEAGRFSLQMEQIELQPLLEKTIESFKLSTDKRIQTRIADKLPQLRGDADRLTRVLSNLLDNALKYGGDTVTVTAALTGGSVQIDVTDNGTGIPPDEISRIFERFYRGRTSRTNKRGSGLGLAIVDEIVRAHGGTIRCESEQGKTTSMIVRLPAGNDSADH